jgi:hypothetical protein
MSNTFINGSLEYIVDLFNGVNNTTFNNISVISVCFIGGGNRRTRRKPTTCTKSLTNFYHIMLYTSPWSRFELTTSVVIGTDYICSCKSNYHTITATLEYSFSVNLWTIKLRPYRSLDIICAYFNLHVTMIIRNSCGNTIVNGMNHHFDMQSQLVLKKIIY